MAITRTPMIDDDGSQRTGTIINNAWKQELYNQIDGTTGVPWNIVPFNAANYTASQGTWSVQAGPEFTDLRWARVGSIVYVSFIVHGGQTLTAASTYLYIRVLNLPLGPAIYTGSTFSYYWGGAPVVYGAGPLEIRAGSNQIALMRDGAGTPWSVMSAACYISGEFFYSVA